MYLLTNNEVSRLTHIHKHDTHTHTHTHMQRQDRLHNASCSDCQVVNIFK